MPAPVCKMQVTRDKCPLCNCPVRIVRRENGAADHYEALEKGELDDVPNPIPPRLDDYLKAKRRGKRTVALVGSAFTSGPWAPFGEPGVDVWSLNETHIAPWLKVEGVTGWFQLHPKWVFAKDHPSKHRDWLSRDWPFHIWMQREFDGVPRSVTYPLREVENQIGVVRGEQRVEKVFSSTFSYMVALALLEKTYERIELYGIELVLDGEYAYQREAMAFWVGKADGAGVEVWMPEDCHLLEMPLYAYEELRKGDGSILMPPENAE